jgi:hypothetical protein
MRTHLPALAAALTAVALFWGGIRVGLAVQGRDASTTLRSVTLLNELVSKSRCVWYMPADSLREHPFRSSATDTTQ